MRKTYRGFGPQKDDFLPQKKNKRGEIVVELIDKQGSPKTAIVAEMVLETFAGPKPDGAKVHYKDGDKTNCALTNLEWK